MRNNRRDTPLPGISLKTVPKIIFLNLKLKVVKTGGVTPVVPLAQGPYDHAGEIHMFY